MTDGEAFPFAAAEFLTVRLTGDPGTPERLLLVGRPSDGGEVHVREWTSRNWSTPGDDFDVPATDLLADIERAFHEHRLAGEEIYKIRRWLET